MTMAFGWESCCSTGSSCWTCSGPLEIYGVLRERFEICLVGPEAGAVASA